MKNLPDYSQVNPITEVVVVRFSGEINVGAAFALLPITRLEHVSLAKAPRNCKRAKAPTTTPGSIIAMNYKGIARGLVLSVITRSFRHSAMLDIAVTWGASSKNLNIKMSGSTLHICGAKSVDQVKEGTGYLFDFLQRIQILLTYIKMNPEAADTAYNWLVQNVRMVEGVAGAHLERPETFPEDIDQYALSLVWFTVHEFASVEALVSHILEVRKLESVYAGRLEVQAIEEHMVKKDFVLQNPPSQLELSRRIDGKMGFRAHYDPSIDLSVEVTREVEHVIANIHGRTKERKNFIFKIHRTKGAGGRSTGMARVKYTGPGGKESEDVYNMFCQLIGDN